MREYSAQSTEYSAQSTVNSAQWVGEKERREEKGDGKKASADRTTDSNAGMVWHGMVLGWFFLLAQ